MRLFDRQPALIAAGWLLAVVLAVLVGVVGIGLVGADLTSRQGSPVSQSQVEQELQGIGSAPPPSRSSSSPSRSPSPSVPVSRKPTKPAASSRSFPTRGGTVVASCERILSMAPAQGFAVHEQGADEGEFRSVEDNHDRIEVDLSCAGGVPRLEVHTKD